MAKSKAQTKTTGQPTSDEKTQAIRMAMDQIEKQFGKGSIMKLGQKGPAAQIESIPTGSIALDLALGIGGLPSGLIV
jgi:recombination protein RecA